METPSAAGVVEGRQRRTGHLLMVRRGNEGEVGIADAVTAMVELHAGPAAARRIASLLGFHLGDAELSRSAPSAGRPTEEEDEDATPASSAPAPRQSAPATP